MVDLNGADSINLDAEFIEAHASNEKGEILATGRILHEMNMSGLMVASDPQKCAPAPPSTFLLVPVAR